MNPAQKKEYQTYYYSQGQQRPTSPSRPPSMSPKPHRRRRKRWPIIGLVLIAIIVAGYITLKPDNPIGSITHSASKVVIKKKVAPPVGLSPASLATLTQSVNSIIAANTGIDTSVSLIDLRNGKAEHFGSDDTFLAASTAKILTAADFLHQVEAGQESLSEIINGNTAQYELQQMIVVSDDNAWDALNNELGYTHLQAYADATLSISDYQAYNNVLSSGDIAIALQKLWDGSLLNKADTQLLLSYLQQANYRQYMVPAVPADDVIYHKIGLYLDNVHDAAIITHGQQAFVIVIFTNGNGTYDWTARATMMQDITKAALAAYFKQ